MIRVGIVGAAGYVGAEVARWVLAHPDLQLAAVVSRSRAGAPLSDAVPGLLGLTDLVLQPFDAEVLSGLDAVVLATPHGAAKPLVDALDAVVGSGPVLVDCSADHRHADGWVYGSPEWHTERLIGARRIAAPGCFATAIQLAVAPFVAAGLLDGPLQIAAATGSTGSGASPVQGTHHPERFANLRAYKVLTHQHVPEVRTFLGGLGDAPELHFVPLSAPVDRGILATCFLRLNADVDAAAVITDAYGHAPAVRIRSGSPELRHVRGTGFCDLAVHQDGRQVVVLSALDNLGKGAASQAVHCLEIALRLPNTLIRKVAPCTP